MTSQFHILHSTSGRTLTPPAIGDFLFLFGVVGGVELVSLFGDKGGVAIESLSCTVYNSVHLKTLFLSMKFLTLDNA